MPRKKKQVTVPPAVPTTSVPSVALLIDGENTVVPDLIAYILVEAGKMGGVTVRQVYGNWAAPSMQSWKKYLAHYALEQMGNYAGHNATDIALVIGAMDLFYAGIRHFCLVAGDSDYVPLVARLRQGGCTVLVIATSAVSKALKEASSRFLATDQLLPQVLSRPVGPSVTSPTPALELSALLTQAYQRVFQKSQAEWVLLAQLGSAVRELCPDFEKTYGKQHLSALIKQYSGCFEVRRRASGKGEVEEVRVQTPHA